MEICLLDINMTATLDARTLVDHARIEAQNHRFTFDEVMMHTPALTISSN
jgi:20S proteasome alpha/beta subunit